MVYFDSAYIAKFYLEEPDSAASASAHGFREIYSNERHVLAAAPLFGLRGASVD